MVNIMSTGGHTQYGLKQFILDNRDDISDLPVDCPTGSTAFVIEDSTVLMLNSQGEWREI